MESGLQRHSCNRNGARLTRLPASGEQGGLQTSLTTECRPCFTKAPSPFLDKDVGKTKIRTHKDREHRASVVYMGKPKPAPRRTTSSKRKAMATSVVTMATPIRDDLNFCKCNYTAWLGGRGGWGRGPGVGVIKFCMCVISLAWQGRTQQGGNWGVAASTVIAS